MNSSLPVSVISFFSHLAERRRRENDLSDVTWSLCCAVPEFASVFAEFIGFGVSAGAVVRVEREVTLGQGSRIDLTCSLDSSTAYIEVKIYDSNYHFQQYADLVPNRVSSALVLLTNHDLNAQQHAIAAELDWRVLHWKDLVTHIEGAFPGDDGLIYAYLRYVKGVCNMIELRDIRFDASTLYSLAVLHSLIEETIGSATHDSFSYSRYPRGQSRSHGPGRTGAYFQIDYRKGDAHRQAWGFFGLAYEEPGCAQLMVWFERDWNAALFETFASNATPIHQGFRLKPSYGFGVAAANEDLQDFLQRSLAGQRDMLASLFGSLMRVVEECLVEPKSVVQE